MINILKSLIVSELRVIIKKKGSEMALLDRVLNYFSPKKAKSASRSQISTDEADLKDSKIERAKVAAIAAALHHHNEQECQSAPTPANSGFLGLATLVAAVHHHNRSKNVDKAKVAAIAAALHHHESSDERKKVAAIAAALHHHELESSSAPANNGLLGLATLVAAVHHHNNKKVGI